MPQFHETGYGRRFFEGQLPRLLTALERIADSLDRKRPPPELPALVLELSNAVQVLAGHLQPSSAGTSRAWAEYHDPLRRVQQAVEALADFGKR